jgi:hypothetical protein
MSETLDRFRNNPRFIASLWNLVPFYLVTWAGKWGENDRSLMSGLLDEPKAIDTMMLLMLGGQYTTGHKWIDQIVGYEIFREAAQKRYDTAMNSFDLTLLTAYEKLLKHGIPKD